jgi:hypothetical protein
MLTPEEINTWLDKVADETPAALSSERKEPESIEDAFTKDKTKWMQFALKISRATSQRDSAFGSVLRPR